MSFMQLAKLKKWDKQSRPAVGVSEVEARSSSSIRVGGSLEMNLSKLRLLVRNSSAVQPLSVGKSRSTHGKKDCLKSMKSINSRDAKKNKGEEWQSVVNIMEDNIDHALSVNSTSQYGYWWNRFDKFCDEFHRQKQPFNAITAAGFLSWLAEVSKGLGGVDQARSALRHFHYLKYPDIPSPTEGMRVDMVVRGIKRKYKKPVQKKKPLSPLDFQKLLVAIVDGCSFTEMKLVNLRFAAQLSLLFCTFSRYEESAALEVNHLEEEGDDLVVLFPKGKQYQFGEARESVILSQPHLDFNPVDILRHYLGRIKTFNNCKWLFPALKCRGKKVELSDDPVSYDCVLRQFKRYAKIGKITGSPQDYGLHSCRRGGVTTAINNGCDEHTVQKQMRVASTKTVARYATLSRNRLKRANVALFK